MKWYVIFKLWMLIDPNSGITLMYPFLVSIESGPTYTVGAPGYVLGAPNSNVQPDPAMPHDTVVFSPYVGKGYVTKSECVAALNVIMPQKQAPKGHKWTALCEQV